MVGDTMSSTKKTTKTATVTTNDHDDALSNGTDSDASLEANMEEHLHAIKLGAGLFALAKAGKFAEFEALVNSSDPELLPNALRYADDEEDTAAHYFARANNVAAIELLIKYKVDFTYGNEDRQDVIDCALLHGSLGVFKLIYKPDLYKKDALKGQLLAAVQKHTTALQQKTPQLKVKLSHK